MAVQYHFAHGSPRLCSLPSRDDVGSRPASRKTRSLRTAHAHSAVLIHELASTSSYFLSKSVKKWLSSTTLLMEPARASRKMAVTHLNEESIHFRPRKRNSRPIFLLGRHHCACAKPKNDNTCPELPSQHLFFPFFTYFPLFSLWSAQKRREMLFEIARSRFPSFNTGGARA